VDDPDLEAAAPAATGLPPQVSRFVGLHLTPVAINEQSPPGVLHVNQTLVTGRQREEWRALAPWSFAVCGFQAVALPVFLSLYDKGANGQGLVEIAEITAGVAWLATVSYRLRSVEPGAHCASFID
jgi:hypothetical protein